MTFKLQIEINGSHPTETIATLGDLVYFIDQMASEFSSQQYVDEEDVPLVITYQGEHNLDPITARPMPSQLTLSKHGPPPRNIIRCSPNFLVGDHVRHNFTGQPYIIKALAYYHINRAYSYLVYDLDTDFSFVVPGSQLMTQHLWKQLPTMLWNMTGNDWSWQEKQGVWQTYYHHSKMRPKDVVDQWKLYLAGNKVPF